MHKIILHGDIGGTKTLLRLSRCSDDECCQLETISQHRFLSNEYETFEQLLDEFFTIYEIEILANPIDACCLAIAGPIQDNIADLTNLDWRIDSQALKQQYGFKHISLVNDFFAIASGIDGLNTNELISLKEGPIVKNQTRAILGAGTGLGIAYQVYHDGEYHTISTEGGHLAFAPVGKEQRDLLDYLSEKYDYISYEHLLSGSGIEKIFDYYSSLEPATASLVASLNKAQENKQDKAQYISQYALAGDCPVALKTLDMFIRIYGRQTANVALSTLAFGGIYIAGGIGAKIQSKIVSGDFINAFLENPQMGYLLEKMSVKLINNPEVGLIGAGLLGSKL